MPLWTYSSEISAGSLMVSNMALRPKLKKGLSLFLIISLFLFTGCSNKAGTSKENNTPKDTQTQNAGEASGEAGETGGTAAVSTVAQTKGDYSDKDLDSSWTEASAVKITLDGKTISADGDGVTIKNGTGTITRAGTYVLSGTLTDGSIIVEAGDDDNVKLVLNNAEMTSSTTAPIYIKNAKNVYLTLAESSVNTITDASEYVYEEASADEPSAAIFSKTDLTVNGNGTLNVKGNFNNAIQSKDDLKIISGTINVTSVDDGIIGKDSVSIKSGNITLNTSGDGIKSSNTEDTSKGFVIIDGGTFHVTSGSDGFQAETSLIVNDGIFQVTTKGGSANAPVKTGDDFGGGFGGRGGQNPSSGTETPDSSASDNSAADSSAADSSASSSTAAEEESSSAKAFKSTSVLTVNGGTFTVDSYDDSFHSNGTLTVTKGTFTLSSGDDAIHGDSSITLSVDSLVIEKSYEGIESETITINGGDISITASDDGINASSGSESTGGGPGGFESSGTAALIINGGTITVNASGDGLDANGSITINDGTVYVSGPTNDGNGALDYDTSFAMNGGTIMAAGSSGMAQTPSDDSKQVSVAYVFDSSQKAGTIVRLEDSGGKEIVTMKPEKNYQYILISSPLLKKNEKYTLFTGGTSSAQNSGNITGSTYEKGTSLYTFTISDTVNANKTIQNTGGPGGGGFGGGGFGGGQKGSRPDNSGGFGGNRDGSQDTMPQPGDGNTPPQMPDGQNSPQAPDGSTDPNASDDGSSI